MSDLIQTLSDALAERGFQIMTAVQEAVTQPELRNVDLLVSAQTGSGKTVAFGLAIAPTLLPDAEAFGPASAPLALVVAPTRELALQVMRELAWLYAKAGARVASCVGGMDMREERRALERGAHIVVGTPGRLRDHIQRGSLDMGQLRAIVLDEADEMLDLGFREDLEFMLGQAPDDRRTLMFSATVPASIARLAEQYLRSPVRVATSSGTSQHADISYQALRVAPIDAENAIINVLRYHEAQNAIVFANTRAAVSRLGARFSNRGLSVVTLSGELGQAARTHALQAMRDGRARVCVATDVAARGIDLPNLELVIHAELPSNADTLLHRSGRTGRAGRKGISVLIVPPKAARKAESLLRTARITADWTTAPSAEDVRHRDEERLLNDPVWAEEPTEEEAAFAERLLKLHGPEGIAAAYLRLYRSRRSAPEELASPDVPPEPKARTPFGPSRWFSLSIGQERRAEARWLLPLLLRAGRLDRGAIGAIRVRPSETFVEIAADRAPGFLAAIGETGEIEEGITVRPLDEAPDLSARAASASQVGHRKRAPVSSLDPARSEGGLGEDAGPPGPGEPRSNHRVSDDVHADRSKWVRETKGSAKPAGRAKGKAAADDKPVASPGRSKPSRQFAKQDAPAGGARRSIPPINSESSKGRPKVVPTGRSRGKPPKGGKR